MIWVEKKKKCIFFMKALLPYSCISLENMFFIYKKKFIIIKARSDKKKPWLYNLNAIEKEWIIWENHKKEI